MKETTILSAAAPRIPFALWALTISVFAIGTTEVVMVGILPDIAKELSIPIARAGSLVTFYALGVAIGGPVITALTSRVPRKLLLLCRGSCPQESRFD